MSFTMQEVVIGALLHDIGKFMQRAKGGTQGVENPNLSMETVLCPTNGKGGYTHKHVLWTDAFFNWMEREALWFPQGVRLQVVRAFANSHHLPDSPRGEAAMGWISALSDRYSSGMDRKPFQEESDTGMKGWDAFRKTPQQCIFDEVLLDPDKLGRPMRNALKLVPLDPRGENQIIPIPWPDGGVDSKLPDLYASLWNDFCDSLRSIIQADLTARLFEEALLGLLERYTWAIPSSTVDIPDISLYDHARTSAAIAACLFRHHEERGEFNDLSAIKDKKRPKFRFLAGDLSGIQPTLFTLQTQGVKGVNKILRARSFMLGAITEAAALRALKLLELPLCCVLQQAGGRFLIITPETMRIETVIRHLRAEFDAWLLDRYTGSLALNLALSQPFGGEAFRPQDFGDLIASLTCLIEDAKQRPLSTSKQGGLKVEYPYDRACAACGIRPSRNDREDDSRCHTCQSEFSLGSELPRATYLCWASDGQRLHGTTDVFGLQVVFRNTAPSSSEIQSLLSVKKIAQYKENEPWARRYIPYFVPTFASPDDVRESRYKGIESPEIEGGVTLKTFEHIGADALEWDTKSEEYKGKPYLAILKADVDRLGLIFSHGLRAKFSLSRFAQLSRMMDLYFTGYLPGLLNREFPSTYVVYAGGDDLLLIGPWYHTLHLAHRVQETFDSYTGRNPNITISSGVSLMQSNHPVGREVHETEGILEAAKDMGRNRVGCSLLKGTMSWERYAEMLEDANWIHGQMNETNYPVSTRFVYNLLKLADDAAAAEGGDISRTGWRGKLAYHLARNVKGESEREIRERRENWLKRLGFDEDFNPLNGKSSLLKWRMALSIALYRNRH